jgi:hypothetical protein
LSVADADALAEAAEIGCVYWRGKERYDWLEQQWALLECHPRQPPALLRFRAAAVLERDAQVSSGGCDSLIEFA